MTPHESEQLSAYLDGELEPTRRKTVEEWIASNPEARKELEQLRSLREAVRGADSELPDIGEEWKQLAAKLETSGDAYAAESSNDRIISFPFGLGAAAAALLLGLVLWFTLPGTDSGAARTAGALSRTVELVETDLEDSSSIVYIDPESGWTVVWVEESTESGPVG